MADSGRSDGPKRDETRARRYLAMRSNRPRRRAEDDDEWDDEWPRDHHVGSAAGAPGRGDDDDEPEPLGGLHGWLYYPDPSSRTGWSTWDVKRRRADNDSPRRTIGFTIPRNTRGDPG
jgi:hypothetical protein